MVMQIKSSAPAAINIKSIKIETPDPGTGFTDPMVWIYTSDEVFTERVSDMLFFFRQNSLIRDFDQDANEVNPGTGWVPTFNWIFSGASLFQDRDVIGDWVAGRLARRDQSKRAIEFYVNGN